MTEREKDAADDTVEKVRYDLLKVRNYEKSEYNLERVIKSLTRERDELKARLPERRVEECEVLEDSDGS